MTRTYTPRRCSKRWLDGDCPPEVLCIIDSGPNDPAPDRYDVIYADVAHTEGYGDWLTGYSLSESGAGSHFELRAHEVAAYRYRMKHRYTTWSSLPEAVKAAVRRDLAPVLRINGDIVPATEFAWDGCHKIYLIRNADERRQMVELGYGKGESEILPVSELPDVWEATCPLRFISSADLTELYVGQGDEEPTITFD